MTRTGTRPRLRAGLVILASGALAALLPACAARTPRGASNKAPTAIFVIVRHAEKSSDEATNPRLTAAGEARAQRLVSMLAAEPLTAVYATAFHRTQATAAPVAQARGLAVHTYDAGEPAADFAARLRHAHRTGTVLVVGHSNTVPAIAAALCRCTVATMPETEYSRFLRLLAPADTFAPAQLQVLSW